MPDIKRTFEYHGAEHKSIACYEAGEDLTPENAAKHTRLHPRCGTSFIFVVMIISILVFSLLPWSNILLRFALQLVFLPLVIGLSFEFIMYAGKHDNILTKILSAPGLAMQKITTREPSLDQLAVALTSLKAAMPEEFPPEDKADSDVSSDGSTAADSGTDSAADAAVHIENKAADESADLPDSAELPDSADSTDASKATQDE